MKSSNFPLGFDLEINSLNFLVISKIFFLRKPISISVMNFYIRPINIIIFNVQIKKLFKKNLFKIFFRKKEKFILKINTRQNILKNLYQIRLFFPEARSNFFKLYPYNRKNIKYNKPIVQFCKRECILFLVKKQNLGQCFPSLQKLFVLKKLKTINITDSNKNLIQYHSYPTYCFVSFLTKIYNFLRFFKKNQTLPVLKINYFPRGFYRLYDKKNYTSKQFIDFFFESRYENILISLKSSENLKIKLTHSLENYNPNFQLFLFCELAQIFSPRISDRLFFRLPFFYFNHKNIFFQRKFPRNNKSFRIIIESNFRIYVYLKKKTETDILQQFSEILYYLPNLFVGNISLKSINKALKNGISSENIFSFIKNNLHSICKKIPINVIEQIKIWELGKKNSFICKAVLATNLKTFFSRGTMKFLNEIIRIRKKKLEVIIFKR